ncbi:hypothetical protein ACLM5J_12615 [Nocardioides sp. Bht2]|uniref:hypothetical protein n=1 Tax=Nocardioides sp. Bht2 TaxID=3392297 RepID=UPI0039B6D1C5
MTTIRTPPGRRSRLHRRAAQGTVLVALGAVLLSGCGDDKGDSDAGGVSESEFCALIERFETSLDANAPTAEQWSEAQQVAEDLADLGVPESFPKELRGDYEQVLALVRAKEPTEFAAATSNWDQAKVARMNEIGDYFEKTCEPLQDQD